LRRIDAAASVSPANSGKALVAVDLAEVNHRPMARPVTARSPDDHQAVAAALKACIETLEAELAKLEACVHWANFEREREPCERLTAEILKATAERMAAREAAARIAGELAAYQARPMVASLGRLSPPPRVSAAPVRPRGKGIWQD
jgi:hypothetical protein